MVSCDGTPAYASSLVGSTTNAGGGVVGAGCTVTLTVTLCPAESRIVSVTDVLVVTLAGVNATMLAAGSATGTSAWLLENARYGGAPPSIVTCVGTPEYASSVDGIA